MYILNFTNPESGTIIYKLDVKDEDYRALRNTIENSYKDKLLLGFKESYGDVYFGDTFIPYEVYSKYLIIIAYVEEEELSEEEAKERLHKIL